MATKPRKVPPEDCLHRLPGAPPPKGTDTARRARAALRGQVRLSPEQLREGMGFTQEQLDVLDAIASGLPVRNSREVMSALQLKAQYLLAKPAIAVDHRVANIQLVSPYPEDVVSTLAPAIDVLALPAASNESDAP